jgi:hypothetical protein
VNSLRIIPEERTRVFRCPNCEKTINLSVHRCPFCSVPIDGRAAEAAADLMDRVNRACSEATDVRTMFDPAEAPLGSAEDVPWRIWGGAGLFGLWTIFVVNLMRWDSQLAAVLGAPTLLILFIFAKKVLRLLVFAIVSPLMAVRWWVRFGSIRSDDSDFVLAKRDVTRIARGSATTLGILLIVAWIGCYRWIHK